MYKNNLNWSSIYENMGLGGGGGISHFLWKENIAADSELKYSNEIVQTILVMRFDTINWTWLLSIGEHVLKKKESYEVAASNSKTDP